MDDPLLEQYTLIVGRLWNFMVNGIFERERERERERETLTSGKAVPHTFPWSKIWTAVGEKLLNTPPSHMNCEFHYEFS